MSHSSLNPSSWNYQHWNSDSHTQPLQSYHSSDSDSHYNEYPADSSHSTYSQQHLSGDYLPHTYYVHAGSEHHSSHTYPGQQSNYPQYYPQSLNPPPPLPQFYTPTSYDVKLSPSSYNIKLSPPPYDVKLFELSGCHAHSGGSSLASSSPSSTSSQLELQRMSSDGRTCSHCGTKGSPLWRRHPATNARLCNACGLYMASHQTNRPGRLIEQAQSGSDSSQRVCTHCFTTQTGSWRRGPNQELLCNACGVYRKLKGRERPVELANDPLKKRGGRKAFC